MIVDAIYSDPCVGSGGEADELTEVGPSVDDLAAALLTQPFTGATGPFATTLGGLPATRIDLAIPDGFDGAACNIPGELQIWYSVPADKYLVLLADGTASVYILDVNGERQVFVTHYRAGTPDEDLTELQTILDSITIDAPRDQPTTTSVRGWPSTVVNAAGAYSWNGFRCSGGSCNVGWMHNGYGSGDVDITFRAVPEQALTEALTDEGATTVRFAGHDGVYRRIDARQEEWIVGIEGTMMEIRLVARPGTSQADLAEAYAIIDSIRTELGDYPRGFRLVFTLSTNDWDSG